MGLSPASSSAGGGGGSGATVIVDSTLAAPAANFDVQTIDQSFKLLRWYLRARSATNAATDSVNLRINNDSTVGHYNYASGALNSGNVTGQSVIQIPNIIAATGGGGSEWSVVEGLIYDYAAAKFQQVFASVAGWAAGGETPNVVSGIFLVAAAVTRLTFTLASGANLITGSRLTILAE
jgi:hypothetical protein